MRRSGKLIFVIAATFRTSEVLVNMLNKEFGELWCSDRLLHGDVSDELRESVDDY